MKKLLFSSILLFALPFSLFADELANIDAALRSAAGLTASFTQKFTPKGFHHVQIEKGDVVFGAPPKMRWTYRTPEKKVFVFDGETSWSYVPEERQVTVTHVGEAQRKEIPFLLLADSATASRQFEVSESRSGEGITTRLVAKDPGAMIRNVAIISDPKSHRVSRLEYDDRQGNHTVFEFSGYRDVKPGNDAFDFVPPAGVEVVRN